MNDTFTNRLRWLARDANAALLRDGLKGVERETLRVTPDGSLSTLPHPRALGSALTNSYITTDYSEALLEFITPAYPTTWEVQQFLCDIHQFVYAHIEDEVLWGASMPCAISSDNEVPIAEYGDSNVGRMKNIYRRGLGYRYGRKMQTIAGVHFNYSLPIDFWPAFQDQEGDTGVLQDFQSSVYMAMVRNVRRHGWLILYLFGMSPALCKSFLPEGSEGLEDLDSSTWYAPRATSLRMSGLGYQNNVQAGLQISANSLEEYVADLTAAIMTPSQAFEEIGVCVDGEYRQLNSHRLQVENEYYSTIRPKRRAASGQRPTLALQQDGVEYVEVRALDVNLFDPTGIDQTQMRFLEAFLIYCGLVDSPSIDAAEHREIEERQALVAREGRRPNLEVPRCGKTAQLQGIALELLDGIASVAALLDGESDGDYAHSVAEQRLKSLDVERTPSAILIEKMRETGASFPEFAMAESQAQRTYFHALRAMPADKYQLFTREAQESLVRQQEVERRDQISFEDYLEQYFSAA